MRETTPVPATRPRTIDGFERLLRPLRRLHRHRVVGLEHIPASGPVLLVVHHTLATYDGFLLGLAIYRELGRAPRGLGDDQIFRIPRLGRLAGEVGIVPASPGAGLSLLAAGELVAVAPGGMWESLRSRDQRYRTRWGDRVGFARLALKAGVPMVLAACPAADEMYTVYPSRITDGLYRRFHVPFPLARGIGPTAIPRPVALTHFLSAPLIPPVYDPERETEQARALADAARVEMESLLQRR